MNALSGALAAGTSVLGYFGQKETNETNKRIAEGQQNFNSAEAAKNREFQERMRSTQYQTAIQDMQSAGLNPMLAYTQGGAGNVSGSQASYSSLPQIGNKMSAALNNSAIAAQIENITAQTGKTEADTEVSKALADKTRAETGYTTTSTANVAQQTTNLKEQIGEIQARISLAHRHASESQSRTFLLDSQQALAETENRLTAGKITLTEAQTIATKINARLNALEIPGAENTADSNKTWFGRNIRPYLGDVGRVTNSAAKSKYLLRD